MLGLRPQTCTTMTDVGQVLATVSDEGVELGLS
jgi:hypothetical protein